MNIYIYKYTDKLEKKHLSNTLRHHIASYDELQYFYTFFLLWTIIFAANEIYDDSGGGFPKLGTTTSSLSRPQSVGICNFAVIFYHRRILKVETDPSASPQADAFTSHSPLLARRLLHEIIMRKKNRPGGVGWGLGG